MSKVTSIYKEIVARLKGDETGIVAAKNERKALSAVGGQIAALNSNIVDLESTVEDAEEALKTAKFPTTLITNNQSYIQGIKNAQDTLDRAKSSLEAAKDSVKYFEELKNSYSTEVDG